MMTTRCFLILSLLALSAFAAPFRFRVRMVWYPQAQFAGFYMAQEKGFYQEAGLDVHISHVNPSSDPFRALEKAKLEAVVGALPNALKARVAGEKIYNFAQLFRNTSIFLVARKSSGIQKLEDISGKKISVWTGNNDMPEEILGSLGIKQYRLFPVMDCTDVFLYGAVDVAFTMEFNEYLKLLEYGLRKQDLVVFPIRDYLPDFAEDGLYATKENLKAHPKEYKAFRDATLRGWELALENPEQTMELIHKYCNEEKRFFLRRFQLKQLMVLENVLDLQNNDGTLSPAMFQHGCKLMRIPEGKIRYEDFVFPFPEAKP